mmetsp:Transcript_92906/g.233575  ORF Transcript_92906/g.233575 Transcript_92906/m.233575 type:complete len:100 (-) Transcript_92906:27-326(-)
MSRSAFGFATESLLASVTRASYARLRSQTCRAVLSSDRTPRRVSFEWCRGSVCRGFEFVEVCMGWCITARGVQRTDGASHAAQTETVLAEMLLKSSQAD